MFSTETKQAICGLIGAMDLLVGFLVKFACNDTHCIRFLSPRNASSTSYSDLHVTACLHVLSLGHVLVAIP